MPSQDREIKGETVGTYSVVRSARKRSPAGLTGQHSNGVPAYGSRFPAHQTSVAAASTSSAGPAAT